MINIKHIFSTVPKTNKNINGFKNKKLSNIPDLKGSYFGKKTTSDLVFFCVKKFFRKQKLSPIELMP